MEFHYGLWNGVSALYSDSGRQLGEENARPFRFNHHIRAETIECKYKGSREGRSINMSALRIAMQNFDAALSITQAVRNHHLGQLPATHELGIWDLYVIARASIALVAYQKRFVRQNAVSPSVSDALSSQYQFISGVFMICRVMMENAQPEIAENRPMAVQALYDYADEHRIFISFNGMACAGSTKKILEFLQFCETGGGPELDLDLSTIVDEPKNWYDYALATIELDCFVERERALKKLALSNGAELSAQKSAEIFGNVGEYALGMMDNPPENTSVQFREGALIRQNHILALLGRQSIKSIPAKHLAARL